MQIERNFNGLAHKNSSSNPPQQLPFDLDGVYTSSRPLMGDDTCIITMIIIIVLYFLSSSWYNSF